MSDADTPEWRPAMHRGTAIVADYKKLEQEEARDGVAMRVHRFVDKRLVTRGIPTADGTGLHYIAEATEIYQL